VQSINLILSGGGARGVAHLGVIKCILENNIAIHSISGTSAGAIAGAFIANGFSPDEVLEIAVQNAAFNIRRPPFNLGLFSKKNMENVLKKYFPEDSFDALKVPLYVSATNINNGTTDYFTSGELVKVLIAASALPVIFPHIEINGFQYLDGGLLNNLPVEPFLEDKLKRIGVHVNPIGIKEHITSTFRIIERSMELAVHKNIHSRRLQCDLFIEPPDLCRFYTYDLPKAREIFNVGYEYAKEHVGEFAESLKLEKQ
jgi:NTE family protein